MPTNLLASNIQFLLRKRRLNPNSLSDLLNNDPPQATIFRILTGESLTPRDKTLKPIADFFGVTTAALRYEDMSAGTHPYSREFLPYPEIKLLGRPIFVIQFPDGNFPEEVWKDGELPMGATSEIAHAASDDPRAFVVPVPDDAMAPRYNIGEYALVEPSIEPEIEDDVLIRLKSGDILLRRLLSRRGGLRVGFYRTPGTQTLNEEEISWVYYVSNPIPARKIVPAP